MGSMKELRDTMRQEAGWVWRTVAKAASREVFLNEETITEMVVLRLADAAQGRNFLVRPFTRPQEKKNGADWEFWFEFGSKLVGLRVQAKRQFRRSGRYESLDPSGQQINDLISRAGIRVPVFVFYNGINRSPLLCKRCRCSEYRSPSYNGCSVAHALDVRNTGSNDPRNIWKFSIPWHCMLCDIKKTFPPAGALQNIPYLNMMSEKVLPPGQLYEASVESRIRVLMARAREKIFSAPDWLDGDLTERRLAGLVLFLSVDPHQE
jgi:hypothetical protein